MQVEWHARAIAECSSDQIPHAKHAEIILYLGNCNQWSWLHKPALWHLICFKNNKKKESQPLKSPTLLRKPCYWTAHTHTPICHHCTHFPIYCKMTVCHVWMLHIVTFHDFNVCWKIKKREKQGGNTFFRADILGGSSSCKARSHAEVPSQVWWVRKSELSPVLMLSHEAPV